MTRVEELPVPLVLPDFAVLEPPLDEQAPMPTARTPAAATVKSLL
jgi:hypothetical protein